MGKVGDFLKQFEDDSLLYKKVKKVALSGPLTEINSEKTLKPIQTVEDYVKFLVKKVYEFDCDDLKKKKKFLEVVIAESFFKDIDRLVHLERANDSSLKIIFDQKYETLKRYEKNYLTD